MRNASGHQCKVKMVERQRKKVNENMYDISSKKRVTKKFLEVSHGSRANQRQRNVQKKCAARAKLFSTALWRCLRRLAITRFYNLSIESFVFSPG